MKIKTLNCRNVFASCDTLKTFNCNLLTRELLCLESCGNFCAQITQRTRCTDYRELACNHICFGDPKVWQVNIFEKSFKKDQLSLKYSKKRRDERVTKTDATENKK